MKFPRKPTHQDVTTLAELATQLDQQIEGGAATIQTIVGQHVDYEALEYVAFQRALRLFGGPEMTMGQATAHSKDIIRCAAIYLEAFTIGAQFNDADVERIEREG